MLGTRNVSDLGNYYVSYLQCLGPEMYQIWEIIIITTIISYCNLNIRTNFFVL
jgi:hypothetical protein